MESFLSDWERRRLASLLLITARLLLLAFVLAALFPLLPPQPLDSSWQLIFTNSLSANGLLALVAMVFVHLAAAIDPKSEALQHIRFRWARLCSFLPAAFVLLVPLQLLAAWQSFDGANVARRLESQKQLQNIATFRRAVTTASSVPALQSNLADIKAPPLSPTDQAMGLPTLRSSMLSQLNAAELKTRSSSAGQIPGATSLMQSTLRVVLLSLALALGFRAASPGPLP